MYLFNFGPLLTQDNSDRLINTCQKLDLILQSDGPNFSLLGPPSMSCKRGTGQIVALYRVSASNDVRCVHRVRPHTMSRARRTSPTQWQSLGPGATTPATVSLSIQTALLSRFEASNARITQRTTRSSLRDSLIATHSALSTCGKLGLPPLRISIEPRVIFDGIFLFVLLILFVVRVYDYMGESMKEESTRWYVEFLRIPETWNIT